ncbi:hypothetical protein CF326_g8848 [Tilletia indica]|nr:hypothetical protein CF326_g8848 [Tilletia indica]
MSFADHTTSMDDFSSPPSSQSSPPRKTPLRARPFPPAHIDVHNNMSHSDPLADRCRSHDNKFEPRARERAVPSSSSQAIAIGVPSILVKPFRTPLLPKRRMWDTAEDQQQGPNGSRSSKIPRRLGTTPARATMPKKSVGIYIPKRPLQSPSPGVDDNASEDRIYAGGSSYRRDSGAGERPQGEGREVQIMRQRRPDSCLGLLTDTDLNVEEQHGSMYAPVRPHFGSSSLNEDMITEAEDAMPKARAGGGRGHFEFGQEFVLSPRLRHVRPIDHSIHAEVGESMLYDRLPGQLSDLPAEDRWSIADGSYEARREPQPYSSPQVKPRSSSPCERLAPSSLSDQDQDVHQHVAPSQWGQLDSAYDVDNNGPRHNLMDELEFHEARARAPTHAMNELCHALGGHDGAADDYGLGGCGRADAMPMARPDGDEGHHDLDSSREGYPVDINDGTDDARGGWESSHTAAEADCGLEDVGDVNGDDLPSLRELQSSMQIRIVTSSHAQAS